mgnify:CR=1 FL=1
MLISDLVESFFFGVTEFLHEPSATVCWWILPICLSSIHLKIVDNDKLQLCNFFPILNWLYCFLLFTDVISSCNNSIRWFHYFSHFWFNSSNSKWYVHCIYPRKGSRLAIWWWKKILMYPLKWIFGIYGNISVNSSGKWIQL